MKQPVTCGECWQCRASRVNDYIGRMLCEASVSDWTVTLTLTYGPRDGDLADKVIHPPHFQNFVRSLRRGGHSLRYFVVGEYGELRDRAHFHCILFGSGEKPEWEIGSTAYPGEEKRLSDLQSRGIPVPWPQEINFHMKHWPHGHVFADWGADRRAMAYPCKYLLKGEPGSFWFSLSKKPPLGHAHFQKLALRNVELGALPSSFAYVPPGGGNHKYLMTGATRRDYLTTLKTEWEKKRPLDKRKLCEWVRERLEKVELDIQRSAVPDMETPEFMKVFKDELDQERISDEAVKYLLYRTTFFECTYDERNDYGT